MKIEYFLETDNEINVKDEWGVLGGFRIVYNDQILTKYVDYQSDEGYHSERIFHDLKVWMRSIKELVVKGSTELGIVDSLTTFKFLLKNDSIYLLIDAGNTETNKLYPGEGKGYPIPAKLFLKEIVTLGHRFIDDIAARYKNMDPVEINNFKKALGEADHYVNEYMKTH
ncbi:hypothetical protein [Methanocella sp. MCL-LM]|uniref:hypothetical protein n=1 Tax=Methanocella sp. MCL-LM TaxID=3412035 RepID=UPI003C74CFF4